MTRPTPRARSTKIGTASSWGRAPRSWCWRSGPAPWRGGPGSTPSAPPTRSPTTRLPSPPPAPPRPRLRPGLPAARGPRGGARHRAHQLVRFRRDQRVARAAADVSVPPGFSSNPEDLLMPKQLRPLAAEFVGTLLFVFLGAGSVVALMAAGTTAPRI